MRSLLASLLAAGLGLLFSFQTPAELILQNGNVITVDPARPRAEAVAIKDGRILAVGSAEEVAKYRGPSTRILDLQGKTAMPGLIDGHLHFPRLGKRLKTLFLDKTRSVDEALAIVAREVQKLKPGEWLTGQGWHTVTWKQGYPDNSGLNHLAPQNPVFLVGMASHAAWVNDLALERAGVTRDTPDPPGGQILRDPASGKPTGILLETAQDLVSRVMPPETRETRKADIRLSVETAARLGLTGIHDAGVGYEDIEIYKELLAEGAFDVRLYVMFLVPNAGPVLEGFVKNPPEVGLGDHRLTIRSIKAFADGALGARGAALLEPYSDSPGVTGLLQNSEEELYQLVTKAMKAGYQVAIHAIGDRGNRIALNAIERAQKALPGRDPRHRIEHAQILSPEDMPRFAGLGVLPSMQPIHATMDMGFAEARVGPQRIRGGYAWGSLVSSGARIVASSDTPSFPVDYSNPLWGIHAAVTRQDQDGQPPGGWYPEEKVSRLDALKMYTVNAAYAAFEEDIKGTLAPGKLADITVLSRDILSIPEREILETRVLMTILGGKIVYQNPDF
jgi:predicted amidohydrolase YtcJ